MTRMQPTSLPWAIWQLAPDSDQQRRHIIVTADGEQEITGIIHREADARYIVHCVNSHGKLLEVLSNCANLLADYDASDGPEGEAWREAVAVLADAAENPPPEPPKPIIIEVRGGMMQDVRNVPPGYDYEMVDHDNLEAAGESAATSNCSSSEPTNQHRARWASNALAAFTAETFHGDHPDTMPRDDLRCAIADFIADLLHLADQKGFDPQRILEQGNTHFRTEVLYCDGRQP